jgi:hypothetical protein
MKPPRPPLIVAKDTPTEAEAFARKLFSTELGIGGSPLDGRLPMDAKIRSAR